MWTIQFCINFGTFIALLCQFITASGFSSKATVQERRK